jgi:hypothetical protein
MFLFCSPRVKRLVKRAVRPAEAGAVVDRRGGSHRINQPGQIQLADVLKSGAGTKTKSAT